MSVHEKAQPEDMFDLVVVGGGMGGLATAALAQRLGLRTALLEAHTKLGGCAGYFSRGDYRFDVGATALVGVKPGEVIADLLAVLGIDFATEPTRSYRVHLPDRCLDVVADDRLFEQNALATFAPSSSRSARMQRLFWRLQAALGETLLDAAKRVPRLPVRSIGDLLHDVRSLGLAGLLSGSAACLTVQDVLRILGLNNDLPFRSLIAILLEDTAQAGPEVVPFPNAAACIQAYRRGMSRPRGGMAALVEGIGQRFSALGGDLRTATLVDRVEPIAEPGGSRGYRQKARPRCFAVTTRRRHRLVARHVALNLPLDLAARLLGRALSGRLAGRERQSRATWSAFTGYVVFDRTSVPDSSPLFHQVLQAYDPPTHDGNNVLVSLSPVEDKGYGPADVRVATLSTHTRPADWQDLEGEGYREKKAIFRSRLLAALGSALPGAPESLIHSEFASPRSFQRYTRRLAGAVGGAPVTRSNSNFFAVDSDVFGPGIWIVGDSVFPGQGTMATVLSAIRVVERITGISWAEFRHRPRNQAGAGDDDRPGGHSDSKSERDVGLVSRPGKS
jgi:phytoene dehydrogenase-like protein